MRRVLALVLLAAALGAGLWFLLRPAGEGTGTGDPVGSRDAPKAEPAPVELQPGTGSARGSSPVDRPARTEASDVAGRLVVRVEGPAGKPVSVPVEVQVRDATGRSVQRAVDGEGRVVFEGLSPGGAWLYAVARGFTQPHDVRATLSRGNDTEEVLRVEPGASVAGRVLAARTGASVADAAVHVRGGGTLGNESTVGGRPSYGTVRTDAEGRFETPGLPFDTIVTLVVDARGFRHHESAHRLLPIEGERERLEIRLDPGGVLRGQVTDPDGRPTPGALVRVGREELGVPSEHDANRFDDTERALGATTDATGRFTVEGLALGVPLCAVAYEVGYGASQPRSGLLLTEDRPEAQVDFALRRPGKIVVRAREPSGKPAGGGSVRLGPFETHLGEDGSTAFPLLTPGEHALDLQVPGFLRIRERIDVPDGGTVEREFTLDPGVSIAGVVVDDLGRRVADAHVSAFREDVEDGDGGGAASDEQGRFRIGGLARGTYGLEARATGASSLPRSGVKAPSTDVEIVVRRNARITARFTVPPGVTPPKSLEVGDYAPEGEGGSGTRDWEGGEVVWDTESGKRVLTVEAEGFVFWRHEVEAAPAQVLDLGVVPLDPGVTITGRVTEASGRPATGAMVESLGHGGRRAQSAADGSFRLEHMPRGGVRLVATAAGFVPTTVGVETARGAAPVAITLLRGGRLRVVVLDAGGDRARDVRLHVHAPSHSHPDDPGRWSWPPTGDGETHVRLVPGRYRVDVLRDEDIVATAEVTLEEGKETPLEIRLPADR